MPGPEIILRLPVPIGVVPGPAAKCESPVRWLMIDQFWRFVGVTVNGVFVTVKAVDAGPPAEFKLPAASAAAPEFTEATTFPFPFIPLTEMVYGPEPLIKATSVPPVVDAERSMSAASSKSVTGRGINPWERKRIAPFKLLRPGNLNLWKGN